MSDTVLRDYDRIPERYAHEFSGELKGEAGRADECRALSRQPIAFASEC
jgi:hypothetical protein